MEVGHCHGVDVTEQFMEVGFLLSPYRFQGPNVGSKLYQLSHLTGFIFFNLFYIYSII